MNKYHVTKWCPTCGKAKEYTTSLHVGDPTITSADTTMPDFCTCWAIPTSVNTASITYHDPYLNNAISGDAIYRSCIVPASLEEIRQIVREELTKLLPEKANNK